MLKIELHLAIDNRDTERLGKVIQKVEAYITVKDVIAAYNNSECVVIGTTECSAGEVMVRTMQDIGRPMLRKCITNYDLLQLSTRPQAHVPTEQEVIAARKAKEERNTQLCDGGIGCDPDYCLVHGT